MKTFEPALKNITIYVKYAVLLLGQLWWKIGLLLILSSGHTAFECKTATTTAIGTLKNVFAKNATYERTNGWNVSPMDDCLLQYFPFYKVTYLQHQIITFCLKQCESPVFYSHCQCFQAKTAAIIFLQQIHDDIKPSKNYPILAFKLTTSQSWASCHYNLTSEPAKWSVNLLHGYEVRVWIPLPVPVRTGKKWENSLNRPLVLS